MSGLYLFGVPGKVGGAATKITHLIRLLRGRLAVTVVAANEATLNEKRVRANLRELGVPGATLKSLPPRLEGVALAVCEKSFFSSGAAAEVKRRGLRLVWSNEMMWPFEGEAQAVRDGLVDRVLFVSEFQADSFKEMYEGVASRLTGNYIEPGEFPRMERRHPVLTIGRLSRPDPVKYPYDFPVFYEALGVEDSQFRVMAWSEALRKHFCWHRFGSRWELLSEGQQPAPSFLGSLDLFIYPLGHRVKESWGRSVVEAMLTGCPTVVPRGHQFEKLMAHGESGFICGPFEEWRAVVTELAENHAFRSRVGLAAAEHARRHLCNAEEHLGVWLDALTFP